MPDSERDAIRKCYCPDDCNCHYAWRTTVCGCEGHDREKASEDIDGFEGDPAYSTGWSS